MPIYTVRYYDLNPYDPRDRYQINRENVEAETADDAADIMVLAGKEIIDVELKEG